MTDPLQADPSRPTAPYLVISHLQSPEEDHNLFYFLLKQLSRTRQLYLIHRVFGLTVRGLQGAFPHKTIKKRIGPEVTRSILRILICRNLHNEPRRTRVFQCLRAHLTTKELAASREKDDVKEGTLLSYYADVYE